MFDGSFKVFFRKLNGGIKWFVVGENDGGYVESSGECCFIFDGCYVLSGGKLDLLIWDMFMILDLK